MAKDEFTKLFSYMSERFDRIDKTLEDKASSTDFQKVMTKLDALMKLQEITDDERLVMASQLTRLHEWVEQAAKRIDLKFVR